MRSHREASILNGRQRQAVEFGITKGAKASKRPLLVLAGAGSGKTRVLAHRVAYLIENGADHDRILLLTFTRLAAAEMTQRVGTLIGSSPRPGTQDHTNKLLWAGTFHSVGLKLLRIMARDVNLRTDFTVLDASSAHDLMHAVREDLGFDKRDLGVPPASKCQDINSFRVNAQCKLEMVLQRRFSEYCNQQADLKKLFAAYNKAKIDQNVVDFDDLLRLWLKLMRRPKARKEIQKIWDHVLVDEYQDTNALQAQILKCIKLDGSGLTVVGDDFQAIYSFRAADVENIIDFPEQFDPTAKIIELPTNYRSTAAILDAANAVIVEAPTGYKKQLRTPKGGPIGPKPNLVTVADDRAQATYVVDKVLAYRDKGTPLSEQVVLFRVGDHSVEIEAECRRRDIAFVKLGGNAFVDRPHVRNTLAAFAWAENPKDKTAAMRLLTQLDGVGSATAKQYTSSIEGRKILAALRSFKPPAKAVAGWRDVLVLMTILRKRDASWRQQISAVSRWSTSRIKADDQYAAKQERDIAMLLGVAGTSEGRADFLANFAIDPPAFATAEASDQLVLSTIHGVKGKEFEAVFLINVVDGGLPISHALRNPALIAEERRLLYVAMTRAKRRLTLVMPNKSAYVRQRTAPLGDREPVANRSRFIKAGMLDLFKERDRSRTK